MTAAVACCQPLPVVQIRLRTRVVVDAVLSTRNTVAKPPDASVQNTSLHSVRVLLPGGAAKVWSSFEVPLVSVVDPTTAACAPECVGAETTDANPLATVHALRSPVSNPPFTTALEPPEPVTVSV